VDADPHAERPWLATEYVAAPTLTELVAACGPLSEGLVRWLAVGCLQALIAVHRVGLIHRDVKPSNILVAERGPLLIDFGLAHEAGDAHLTRTDASPGTPAFMAPEQIDRRDELSTAADVYALAATLTFAASGHPPYSGPGVEATLYQILTGTPDLTGVPEQLARILADCLARAADSRPTCAELLDRLDDVPMAAPLSAEGRALVERHAAAARHLQHEQLRTMATSPEQAETPEQAEEAEPADTRRRSTSSAHARRRGVMTPARTWMAAVAGSTAVIGITAGLVYGVLSAWPNPATPLDTVAARAGSADSVSPGPSGYPQGPPPGGPGGPPPWPPPDAVLTVGPASGGPGTVFTVRGTGWPPGQPVSIDLEVPGAAPLFALANSDGTFETTFRPGVLEHRTNGAAPGSFILHAYAGPAEADADFTVSVSVSASASGSGG
jgi:hypothetical protein